MRAAELMEDWPRVEASEPALRAAEIIGVEGLPAVVVVDRGRPRAVLGSAEVLALLVPRYVQEDPSLAGVSDDDPVLDRLRGKTVAEVLPTARDGSLPSVRAGASAAECAAVMARLHAPVLTVVDDQRQLLGVVRASRILSLLF